VTPEGAEGSVHIIIGGCGRVGAELADQLSREDHDVVVLDKSMESFDRIGGGFNGETLTGDITDKDALQRAGIERADGVAAVTNLDNANLMAVQIATELFDVKYTVARLFNPQREESYRKMGVHYVSGTRLVSKAIMNELHTDSYPQHVSFEDADVQVIEVTMHLDSDGLTVAELEDRGDIRVAALRRGERVYVARAADRLRNGDLVVMAAKDSARRKLRNMCWHPVGD
jgi:trk system potassium uptake protein